MLSCSVTVLAIDEGDQLGIGQRNHLPAAQSAVERHLERVGHVLDGHAVGHIELVIGSVRVDAKGVDDDR